MFNGEVIEQYRDGSGQTVAESIQIFKESVIENYLECNKENAIQNYNKADKNKNCAMVPFLQDRYLFPLL